MSVRRNTTNRRMLYRVCGTCGKSIETMADSPLVRSIVQPDKRHVTTYYCSSSCLKESYKRSGWCNGNVTEKKRLYYDRHREEILIKSKERYRADPETFIESTRFYRKKRKAMQLSADQKGMNENV